ncbi:unnamed protein product [Zymoseptoria tritici ST99CH_1A5]|uniref:Uncharacterized protein n=1 Tax=Zymoseptoria tritici ST99CH_1A5 TaxID=1276529 RepID=A0A1Y6M0U0_ZYMTR|nr:unnamed protein product [Zymoseptoria tritici ST99CH_1A5]
MSGSASPHQLATCVYKSSTIWQTLAATLAPSKNPNEVQHKARTYTHSKAFEMLLTSQRMRRGRHKPFSKSVNARDSAT